MDHVFLTSVLVGGEWSAFTPQPLYPWGKSPWYPLDRNIPSLIFQLLYIVIRTVTTYPRQKVALSAIISIEIEIGLCTTYFSDLL
jgi:hypothetical protein